MPVPLYFNHCISNEHGITQYTGPKPAEQCLPVVVAPDSDPISVVLSGPISAVIDPDSDPIGSATQPTIFNISIPLADIEVAQVLPTDTKRFLIKVRENTATLQLAYISGGNTLFIPRGFTYTEEQLDPDFLTLYIKTNKPNQIVEIVAWA